MPAHERNPVEGILASREVSKPRLTDDEGAAILGHHGSLIDELEYQEMQRFATEVINPSAQAVELAQEAGIAFASDEVTEQIDDRTGTAVQAMPEATLAAPEEGVSLPAGCQMFFLEPPYDYAGPTPELTSETEPPWVYKSTSELGIAETGDLSLAVGAGKWFDVRWPTPESALININSRSVSASILEIFDFFSPLTTPTRADVTVDIRVGLPLLHPHYTVLSPATSPDGAPGIVAVIGDCYLTLYPGGGPSLGGHSTSRERFLIYARRANMRRALGFDRRYLRLSATLFPCPGVRSILVVVEARLIALWSLATPENPGFAGVDLRTTAQSTAGVVPYQPAAGPLSVTRMGFMLCREPDEICT
jgi:hypothetical protein